MGSRPSKQRHAPKHHLRPRRRAGECDRQLHILADDRAGDNTRRSPTIVSPLPLRARSRRLGLSGASPPLRIQLIGQWEQRAARVTNRRSLTKAHCHLTDVPHSLLLSNPGRLSVGIRANVGRSSGIFVSGIHRGVSEREHKHHEDAVVDCVDDAVVPDADAPPARPSRQRLCSRRPRILCEERDRTLDSPCDRRVEFPERAYGGRPQFNPVFGQAATRSSRGRA